MCVCACVSLSNHVFLNPSSYDGVLLVTQNHETLPQELECLKAPLQDYSSVGTHKQQHDILILV